MPKLTLNYCTIVDVVQVEPKPTDNQRKNRKVILHADEAWNGANSVTLKATNRNTFQ